MTCDDTSSTVRFHDITISHWLHPSFSWKNQDVAWLKILQFAQLRAQRGSKGCRFLRKDLNGKKCATGQQPAARTQQIEGKHVREFLENTNILWGQVFEKKKETMFLEKMSPEMKPAVAECEPRQVFWFHWDPCRYVATYVQSVRGICKARWTMWKMFTGLPSHLLAKKYVVPMFKIIISIYLSMFAAFSSSQTLHFFGFTPFWSCWS